MESEKGTESKRIEVPEFDFSGKGNDPREKGEDHQHFLSVRECRVSSKGRLLRQ
jgi:hypothetical protein